MPEQTINAISEGLKLFPSLLLEALGVYHKINPFDYEPIATISRIFWILVLILAILWPTNKIIKRLASKQ